MRISMTWFQSDSRLINELSLFIWCMSLASLSKESGSCTEMDTFFLSALGSPRPGRGWFALWQRLCISGALFRTLVLANYCLTVNLFLFCLLLFTGWNVKAFLEAIPLLWPLYRWYWCFVFDIMLLFQARFIFQGTRRYCERVISKIFLHFPAVNIFIFQLIWL